MPLFKVVRTRTVTDEIVVDTPSAELAHISAEKANPADWKMVEDRTDQLHIYTLSPIYQRGSRC